MIINFGQMNGFLSFFGIIKNFQRKNLFLPKYIFINMFYLLKSKNVSNLKRF